MKEGRKSYSCRQALQAGKHHLHYNYNYADTNIAAFDNRNSLSLLLERHLKSLLHLNNLLHLDERLLHSNSTPEVCRYASQRLDSATS